MVSVKARVTNGRLMVDEATDLPEGTEVRLVAVLEHGEDALGDADRDALHRALASAADDIREGRLVDGDEVMASLRKAK